MDDFTNEIGRLMRADALPARSVDSALADVRRLADARRRNRTIAVVAAAAASVAVAVGISAAVIGGAPAVDPITPMTDPADSGDVVPWSDRTDFEEWEPPTAPQEGWPAEPPVRWDGLSAGVKLPESVAAGETLEYVVTLTNHADTHVDLAPCPGYRQSLVGTDRNADVIWVGIQSEHRLNCDSATVLPAGATQQYAMELDVPADAPRLGSAYLEWQLIDTAPDQRGEDYLAIDSERSPAAPENAIDESERVSTADAYISFARSGAPRVPFADQVAYYIGGQEVTVLSREEALDRDEWIGCRHGVETYAERTCEISPIISIDPQYPASEPLPFEGLHLEHEVVEVTGCHTRAPLDDYAGAEVVVIRPREIQACMDDFAVALYLNELGQIVAVNLTIGAP